MKIDKIINLFMAIILAIILLSNLKCLPIFLAIFIIAITIFIIKKFDINDKFFIILIILVTLITHLACIYLIKNPQVSDFETLFDISQDLLDGNLNIISQNYVDTWPYQVPFILYQTVLLKICNSTLFLKIINTIVNTFISLLIYSISKKLSNKKSAQIVTILYMLFINKILYNNILSNQIPQILFLLLGLNIFISNKIKNEKIKVLLFAICTGIANLFRPEGIIILLSFICYEIYKLIKEKKYANVIINILIFIIVYLLICNGTMFLINKTIINNPKDIGILYKLVLGLDINSGGKWSLEGFNKLFIFQNETDLLNYEKEQIIKSLTNIKIFKLFILKINTFWNHLDMSWTLNYLQNNKNILGISYSALYSTLYNYDSTIWLFIIIFTIIGVKEYNQKNIILNIILVANFAIYLFIEVQGRYGAFSRILLFIIASNGLKKILETNKFCKNVKTKKGCESND